MAHEELLSYYERELTFLRQMGAQFAEKYPKIASRLLLEPNRCEDPHVERTIEAFALLAARVHLRVDDEFPEATQALLSMVYPHYVRPIPSMSVVEFVLDPEQGRISAGLDIPRGSVLYSRPVGGFPCRFRTVYDTVLWPLSVVNAQWTSPDRLDPVVKAPNGSSALRLELRCEGDARFDQLHMRPLRFYLNGEGNLVHTLYELLCCSCTQILLRDPTPRTRQRPLILPPEMLQPVGFAEDEGALPYPRRAFLGYRLLQEYTAFPEKFLFLDLHGMEPLLGSGFRSALEIVFLFAPFERAERTQAIEVGISAKTFRLGCAPIVNLFPQTAEPILLEEKRYEYPVIPDVRRQKELEVFSVDEVVSTNPASHEVVSFAPFYSLRHGMAHNGQATYWHATRRASVRLDDEGTEMNIALMDHSGRPVRPAFDTLTIRTTCTNRELPFRLPFGSESGDFELEGASPVERITALRKPTNTIRPPVGDAAMWRLISHLSLNYLSLVEEGKDALQAILRLYDFSTTPSIGKHIEGISRIESHPHFARVVSENGIAFVRGTRVSMELDEEQFVGGGVFLFASVLEHFLGLYACLNTFSQLVVTTRQRKEALKEWPARAGQSIIL